MTILISAARAAELAAAGQTNNPFVAWDNLAATATVQSGNTSKPDGALTNAITGTTFDYWRPNVTGTTVQFRITLPVALSISFVGVAAHNLASLGASAQVQRSTNSGSTWTTGGVAATPIADNGPVAFRMATTGNDALDWRVNITGLTSGADLYAGVIFFGFDLVIPTRLYSGYSPAIVPTEVQLQSNVSVGGNLLGSQIIGQGSTLAAGLRYLTPGFVRGASWLSFMRHYNAGKGLFFAWRPATFADDVHYCWREGAALRPSNMGVRDYMACDLNMRAYDG
jgi:hypothetical protein